MLDKIVIKGARVNNLQNLNLELPKNKLIVITGLSGSGKSSLAFDTIYAEGQRKYVESLSAYARQFLGLMEKPDVDYIEGLSPAISIDQKGTSKNPRSTVGTVTEIYDYLRLLYARVGEPHCPKCGKKVESQTIQDITDTVLKLPAKLKVDEVKVIILSPLIKSRKGTYEELFNSLLSKGFVRVRVDGELFQLEDEIKLDRYKKHDIEIVIDRLVIDSATKKDEDALKRITDSLERGINLSEGEITVSVLQDNGKTKDYFYSEKFACTSCDISFPEIEPHTFSFNSPHGACTFCDGLGIVRKIDPTLVFNPKLSITEGGIYAWSRSIDVDSWRISRIKTVAKHFGFDIRKPLGELDEDALNIVLYGSGTKKFLVEHEDRYGNISKYSTVYEGVIPNLERRYKETDSDYIRMEIEKYMRDIVCSSCQGKRLKPEALAVQIEGKNIYEITNISIDELYAWMQYLSSDKSKLTKTSKEIGKLVFKEILTRLNFLISVGLGYLTISRTAKTLSGGEARRIRLASQIGTGLTGVLYVLDEPSIGLHQRDNERLLLSLANLRDLGNTVIVVEHDEDTIRRADWIVDLGPGAGEHGGHLVAEGKIDNILKCKDSMTGKYLSGQKIVGKDFIKESQNGNGKKLTIKNASEHNLKNIDVDIPLGKFVVVTGVSGSGKSTLVNEILYNASANYFNRSNKRVGAHDRVEGFDQLDKVINIDQSAIGRTPRSNPATYTGLFTYIREVFSMTQEARARGYKAGRFSFNVKGGRCENCHGDGVIKIEMQFLPDVYVECEVCKGSRYNREALQIDYKGKNIAEVLDMTVEEASKLFDKVPKIANKLKVLDSVGLGYIKLGQRSTTLSGGEAQRIKLALELSKRSTGKTFYILDEPTTGLHFADIDKLLLVLHSLVKKGNSILVIEHNLDVIKTADWIIDLGPEGGDAGGEIVAEGSVADIIANKKSHTGEWLSKLKLK